MKLALYIAAAVVAGYILGVMYPSFGAQLKSTVSGS